MTIGKLDEKNELCPLSGIGKTPGEWGACVVQCGWYDASTGLCSVHALWNLRDSWSIEQCAMHLRELPRIEADLDSVAEGVGVR